MKYHGTMKRNAKGALEVGGVSVQALAKEFGTPLYIYDQRLLEETLSMFIAAFSHDKIKGIVAYASKAFLTIGMAQLVNQFGLSIDVASGGELYTVFKAGFPMDRVYFHGNNKTPEELEMALEYGCTVILDNAMEAKRLGDLAFEKKKSIQVYLRVNPGIDVLTHDYIKTSKLDSKFGLNIGNEKTIDLIQDLNENPYLMLKGLHAHIGSQIFQTEPFFENVNVLLETYVKLKESGIDLKHLNVGGGFGVYYTQGDVPMDLPSFLNKLIDHVYQQSLLHELNLESVSIEPGRSIVSNAGSTLYTVGGIKHTDSEKTYVFIDGGMSDNPRVALYQAEYEAEIANKDAGEIGNYAIAGKLCESGDILSHKIALRNPEANDLLLMSSTGAYTFSMSSNYNRMMRPAVVFVKDGKAKLNVKRQTLADLVVGDLSL